MRTFLCRLHVFKAVIRLQSIAPDNTAPDLFNLGLITLNDDGLSADVRHPFVFGSSLVRALRKIRVSSCNYNVKVDVNAIYKSETQNAAEADGNVISFAGIWWS